MEELFESTNGGLKQSELDASVVNLLSKLEPDLCRQAIEKFKSVTKLQDAMETKVLFPAFYHVKICHIYPMEHLLM